MIKLIYPEFWSKNGFLSYLFTPFSYIYVFLGFLRKFFAKPIKFDIPVICIGNMSVGGTGKTQLVLWLGKRFFKDKVNVLVVTKAYGSRLKGAKMVTSKDSPNEVGDESILLNQYVPVLAAKNIKLAKNIIDEMNPDLLIFDDGIQNPGFEKDINILVVDSKRGIGNGKIFPSGPLREKPDNAIARSDAIIVIGNDDDSKYNIPTFNAKIKLLNKIDISKKYYAFTAIGNPERFYKSLEENNVILTGTRSFPDHHNFTETEISSLKNEAKKIRASLITTEKDYVKIKDSKDIVCAASELEFSENDDLYKYLKGIIWNK